MTEKLLTILMPCLNEAQTIEGCIREALKFLTRSGHAGEVLIADNGSTDGSQALAIKAGARVIQVELKGYGAALRAGIEASHSRFVIMGDSDASYDFSNLDGFVAALTEGHQLVMGNRFAGGIAHGAMPRLHRYLGNPVLSFLGRVFFDSPLRDFHCGLRGFDRRAVLALGLHSNGMEFASEMIVKATLADLKIGEVATTLSPDGRGRPPHLRSWRDGWRHLRFLLIHAPAWLFMFPGLLLLTVGTVLTAILAGGQLPLGWATLDIHTMLYTGVAACLGLQMVMFAGASSSHAVKIGVLPSLPKGLGWVKETPLEAFLLLGGALFSCGLALAIYSVVVWSRVAFTAVDPQSLMRITIPAAILMLAGCQVATTAFLLEFIRLRPKPVSKPITAQAPLDELLSIR